MKLDTLTRKLPDDHTRLQSRLSTHKSRPQKLYPEWNIDNATILEWSKLVNKNYNTLNNIGLSEKVKYELIEQEKKNPGSTITEQDARSRNIKIKAYIMWVFRTYYLIKNSSRVYNLSPDIQNIVQTHENLTQMPDIYDEFDEKYKFYESKLNPTHFSNYLLNFLARLFLNIHQKIENESVKKALLKYLIDEIIASERIMSIPDPLRVIVEKSTDIPPQAVDLTSDDVVDHDEMQDKMVEGVRGVMKVEDEDAEPPPVDEFSLEHLDIDVDDPEAENLVANPGDF